MTPLLSAWIGLAHAGVTLTVPDDAATLADALALAAPDDVVALPAGTHTLPGAPTVPIVGVGPATVLVGTIDASSPVQLRSLTIDGQGLRPLRCVGTSLLLIDVALLDGGDAGDGDGGGLLLSDDCDVALHGVQVDGASIDPGRTGGLIRAVDSHLTLADTSLSNGSAGDGGAASITRGTLYADRLDLLDNRADDGAGLYLDRVDVGVVGGRWADQLATGTGGAARAIDGSLWLVAVDIADNEADRGAGGVDVDGPLTAERLVVTGNRSASGAGGIACSDGPCVVGDSSFDGNEGNTGGGISLVDDTATWRRNVFCGNTATGGFFAGYGGGAYANGSGLAEGNLYVQNTSGFAGGGSSVDGNFTLDHEVYVANEAVTQGSASYVIFGYTDITNTVMVDHPGPGAALGNLFAGVTTAHDLFYDNDGGDSESALDGTDITGQDPALAGVASASCRRADYVPSSGPLIDAGTGPDDPDGSTSDIGLAGGASWDAVDADGDGLSSFLDCDDGDGSVGGLAVLYPDNDGDGFGSRFALGVGCPSPTEVTTTGDCDDTTAEVAPGRAETRDGRDEDCNGLIDDDAARIWYADTDGDGFGDPTASLEAEKAPPGYVDDATDCDDTRDDVSPAGTEICDGSTDEDCDGLVDDDDPGVTETRVWFRDDDSDGYGSPVVRMRACEAPAGSVADDTDCDDTRVDVNPGAAEVCDGSTDEDCDGLVDEDDPSLSDAIPFGYDRDGDGFGGLAGEACEVPGDAVLDVSDCDDTDPAIYPGATEVCDPADVDEDCNGLADDDDPAVQGQVEVPVDADGDGFADPFRTEPACDPLDLPRRDCDDTDARIFPGGNDLPDDGIDQDCDGADAEWLYGRGGCGCDSRGSSGGVWLGLLALGLRRRRAA